MTVVIVESPAKAKTINKYLGKGYTVLASYGHIRDLPSKDGSVKPDEDFAMTWDMDPKSSKRLSDIADAVKSADRVILATDPDREGEAISWHVLEVLTKKRVLKDKIVQRVTFNAITQSAVQAAMAAPRDLDMELVEAYLARLAGLVEELRATARRLGGRYVRVLTDEPLEAPMRRIVLGGKED